MHLARLQKRYASEVRSKYSSPAAYPKRNRTPEKHDSLHEQVVEKPDATTALATVSSPADERVVRDLMKMG